MSIKLIYHWLVLSWYYKIVVGYYGFRMEAVDKIKEWTPIIE